MNSVLWWVQEEVKCIHSGDYQNTSLNMSKASRFYSTLRVQGLLEHEWRLE